MRDTEDLILNIFKNNPSKELNTETIAKEVYRQEYSEIENLSKSTDKTNVHDAKRQKFQLHRKLLYYINKLIDNNIIKVSRTADKGEKYFILQAGEGEIIIEKGYKRTIITKHAISATYIDQYEAKGAMKKYEEDSWINRFNSIMLECSKNPEQGKLYSIIKECFTNINDVIALNEFEHCLNIMNDKESADFFERMIRDTENFDKTVSIIVNIGQANNNLRHFVKEFASRNPQKINIIFNISVKDLQKHSSIIEYIISEFSQAKIKINMKNNELSQSPYFKGRAGIYTFNDDDWDIYTKKIKGNVFGMSCSIGSASLPRSISSRSLSKWDSSAGRLPASSSSPSSPSLFSPLGFILNRHFSSSESCWDSLRLSLPSL